MEDSNKYIAAIDIGTTKIVAIIAQVYYTDNRPSIKVLSYGVEKARGMKRGMINNMGDVIESIRSAANKAKFYSDFNVEEVFVGISGHTIKSQVVNHYKTIPHGVIEKKDLEELHAEVQQIAIKNSEQILHIIPYSYIIDSQFEHKNPVSIEGKRIDGEFHVISADKNFTRSIIQVVKHAGFQTKRLIFEPLAAAEAVLNSDEKEAGVALIDFGGGTTDLIIIHENKILYTDVIPFAGENITEDIQKALQILKNKAEELKVKYGNAIALKHLDNKIIEIPGIHGRTPRTVSAKALAIIIQSRISEIIDTIMEKIQPYVNNGQLAAGFTITGGTSLLNNLHTLIKYRTNLDVRSAYPELADIKDLNKPQFATTQGLILLGDKYLRSNITVTTPNKKTRKKSDFFTNLFNKFLQSFTDEPDDFDD